MKLQIKTDDLVTSSLNYLQTSNELQNSLSILTNMQNHPFSMDHESCYEIYLLQQQLRLLLAKLIRIDQFIKESAYAYEQVEKQLCKQGKAIEKLFVASVSSDTNEFIKWVQKTTNLPSSLSKATWQIFQQCTKPPSQYGVWQWDTMDMYHETNHQGFANRSFRSLIEKGISADLYGSLHIVRLSQTKRIGNEKGKLEFALGNVEIAGKVTGVLFDEKHRFQPEVAAEISACASAIHGLVKLDWHNDFYRSEVSAKGEVGVVGAKGKAVISAKEVTLEGEVGAAAARGEVKGQIELWGASISLTAQGEVGAIGVGGVFSATDHSVEIGGKISCLLGTGWSVKIDW